MSRWTVRGLVISVLVLAVCVAPALAHGYLLRSIPQDRTTLERAPTRLQYWFSEDLEAQFSTITLRDSAGQVLAEGGLDAQNDALLTLRVPNNLPDGAYIVELRPAFSSDGHASLSTSVFFVGQEVGGVTSTAASPYAQPLEVVWKVLLLSGTFLLFGTGMLFTFVLLPAWGNAAYPAGSLPPRVMRRLNALMWIGLVCAISGNVLALLQQSMVFFNVGLDAVLAGGLWQVVRIGSRFGDVWNIRMVFLVLMGVIHGASILYRERYPRSVAGFWSAGTWCMALVLAAQAVVSHAAGSLVMPWMALTMHWLHTLATAFWIGGIAALALTLPVALHNYDTDRRQKALASVMRRFSRLTVGALIVVITTGIYNSSNWFFSPADVVTTYGASLGIKVLLVVLLAGIGGLHHLALNPSLAQRLGVARLPLIRQAGEFHTTLNAETLIAVIVLISASVLSSTPIPQPDFLKRTLPPQTQTIAVDDLNVTMTITPGGTGINSFDVRLLAGTTPIENALVNVQISNPTRDVRGLHRPAEAVGEGLYVATAADITQAGIWWSTVDVRIGDATIQRAAFAWDISTDANVVSSFPASWLTVVSALAVTAACGVVLLPWGRSVYAQLNLAPQSLLIAALVLVISTGFIVISIVGVEGTRQAQLDAQNPAPLVVNPTLPTQDSIQRGDTLYYAHCVIWQSVTDFRAFMNQIDRFRDDTLFAAVRTGWRAMPGCKGALTDAQVWDIVNFVRVLQYQFKPDLFPVVSSTS